MVSLAYWGLAQQGQRSFALLHPATGDFSCSLRPSPRLGLLTRFLFKPSVGLGQQTQGAFPSWGKFSFGKVVELSGGQAYPYLGCWLNPVC